MKERIKKDMMTAMKEKNVVARDILRVLKGEIDRNEQSTKGRIELDDTTIVQLVKKMIDNIRYIGDDNGEVAVLELYVPKQMTYDDMYENAASFISMNKLGLPSDMGRVMGYFKKNYEGIYDGKELSRIVKTLLS